MKRWCRAVVGSVCLFGWLMMAAMVGSAEAQTRAATGDKLLPEETLLYFSFPNVANTRSICPETTFGQLLKDPEFQPVFKQIQAKIDEATKGWEDEIGASYQAVLDMPQGEFTFAIVETGSRIPAAVLMIDSGNQQATAEKILNKLKSKITAQKTNITTKTINGVTVNLIVPPGLEAPASPVKHLACFLHQGYFVLATDVSAVEAILKRWDGKSEETLAENSVYKYIQNKTAIKDSTPVMKWFLNPIGLINSGIAVVQKQVPQASLALGVVPILGLNGWKGWGGNSYWAQGDFDQHTRAFIYTEGTPTGILAMFQMPKAAQQPPKWVPADVATYSAVNWEVQEAYKALESLVDSFAGPGALAREVEKLADADSGPQLHIKKDVIDQITGKVHFLMQPVDPETSPVPPLLIALELKNPAVVKKTLANAAKSDNFNGEKREFEGETIYEAEAGEATFSMAVAEGHLLLGTDSDLVENVIKKGKGTDALVDDSLFKKLAKYFPAETSSISIQQQASQLETVYEQLRDKDSDDKFEGIDLKKLPPFESLEKYLRTNAGYIEPDKKGALFVGYTLKKEE